MGQSEKMNSTVQNGQEAQQDSNVLARRLDFNSEASLWVKDRDILSVDASKRIRFQKRGRFWGSSVVRYAFCFRRRLYYYETESCAEYSGYCSLSNLYAILSQSQSNTCSIRLSNGTQSCQLLLEDQTSFHNLRETIVNEVIQVDFFQQYRVLEQLGEGSTCKVFKVEHRQNGIIEVAKFIRKSESSTSQFIRQKDNLARIDTDRACKLKGFYESDTEYIILTDFFAGKPLAELQTNQSLSLCQKTNLLREILIGLSEIHSVKLVHCDLKPQNVIVSPSCKNIRLIDFGLSLNLSQCTELSSFARCGTYGFMAPEVIKNQGANLAPFDYKCDMFSFGILAYILLLGVNPFLGTSQQETYCNNRDFTLAYDKTSLINLYGFWCHQLISGCLERCPSKRLSAQAALNSNFLNNKEISLHDKSTQVNDQEPPKLYESNLWSQNPRISRSESVPNRKLHN